MLLLVPHGASDGVASVTAVQSLGTDPSRPAVKAWQLGQGKGFRAAESNWADDFFIAKGITVRVGKKIILKLVRPLAT